MGLKCAGIWSANARSSCADTRIACQALPTDVVRQSISGEPRAILVMESAEDGSRDDVLGRDTSDGRQPTCSERRLHAKATMGAAMIVTNVVLENALGVDIVDDDDVVEAIAA